MKKLGKYELLEELGRGGYGTVYRAHDSVLDVERAVKVLHPALVADRVFIERFTREAKYAARLKHPRIVPVYDLGESEGRFYLAMEYMPGGSLKDLLAKESRLPFERAVEITRQIAAALDHIHSHNLIHRDVKPGNILFDEQGNAALTDLGFAKALSGAGSASLSSSGGIIGTPPYIPPEVWRGKEVTPATDEYSLACVFYEMVTGEVLFSGDSPPEIMTKHMLDGPHFPKKWPEGVPEGIEDVLNKALSKEPRARHANAAAFAQALVTLTHEKEKPPKKSSQPGAPETKPMHIPWWQRQGAWLGMGGAGLAAIVIILVIWAIGRPEPNPPIETPIQTISPIPKQTKGSTQILTSTSTFMKTPTLYTGLLINCAYIIKPGDTLQMIFAILNRELSFTGIHCAPIPGNETCAYDPTKPALIIPGWILIIDNVMTSACQSAGGISMPAITPIPTFTPQPMPVYAHIYSAEGGGAIVRSEPGTGVILKSLINNYLIEVLPEVKIYNGVIWVHIRTPDGTEGWVMQMVLIYDTPVPNL